MTPFERDARAFIASCGSPDTRKLYESYLAAWLLHCDLEGVDAASPSLEDAAAYRDQLKAKYAPATVRLRLGALSSMYDYHGAANPFRAKRLKRPPADEVVVTPAYSREEAEAILTEAKKEAVDSIIGVRDAAIIQLLHDTGVRVSTACAMRHDAIHKEGDVHYWITTTKSKGRIEVVLPETTVAAINLWLTAYPQESAFVFPSPKSKMKPIKRTAVYGRIAAYGERAGIKKAGPHRFRATYITEAIDAGIPLHEVQASVHHANPKMTQRYDRGVRGAGVAASLAKFRKGEAT